jgi:hypothetical protein
MNLKPNFSFRPQPAIAQKVHLPFPNMLDPLGPLALLPGTWSGTGFNTIWRPFNGLPQQDRFLELNRMTETLEFAAISGPIPNRGLLQPDINMFGVHYLQQITDANTQAGLHFEPGIWAVVPQTTNPQEPPTVVRMASIPHGTAIVAQGLAQTFDGPPSFEPNNITPFPIGGGQGINFPEVDLSKPSNFRTPPAQLTGITQGMVNNPNSVLQAAITGQTILSTTRLDVSTIPTAPVVGGGTANTAFLVGAAGGPNANAAVASSTFWIETVQGTNGEPDFLQLQYSQTVLLNFNTLSWPHVSVATLRKLAPVSTPPEFVDPDLPSNLLLRIHDAKTPKGR